MIRLTTAGRFTPLLLAMAIANQAAAETLDRKIELLEQAIAEQQSKIESQEARLQDQARTIQRQKQALEDQRLGLELLRNDLLMNARGAGASAPQPQLAQNDPPANNQNQPRPVGQAPKQQQQRSRPIVAELAEVGGVLTPKGVLVVEPSIQYAHSDVNRVTFRGIEILSSLGIGILEAVDADRDGMIAALTGRLGITPRFELELKVPYVIRREKESAAIPQLDETVTSTSLDGRGIGDIEAAFHYQMNSGQDGWPFFILNGRLKFANGKGPFEISRNSEGIGQELATGSGFYSFEPSITALYPSAPAVFFGNLGYVVNIEDNVNTTLGADSDAGAQTIGKVDPGDAVRLSFGMGYSINERAAFTLGFKNDWIQATKTEINGVTVNSSRLNIGSMLLGYSFQLKPNVGINLNLEFGITDDAPDMLMTFRMPFSNKVF